jgi:hypothetical protein
MIGEKKTVLKIEVQAALALMLIQLLHKIVREIPGASDMGGVGAIFTSLMAVVVAVGIVLLALKIKWGLALGALDGASMIIQPILVHIIMAKPDINGIWWYPIFPWTQALLILYFCYVAWKNWM